MTGDASYAALLTPRQRVFVQEIIKGSTYSRAYTRAGYKGSTQEVVQANASTLLRNQKVKAAIEGARLAAQQRLEVTTDTIVERLDQARMIALTTKPPQVAAAVAAIMGQAKVLGLVIDRSEMTVIRDKPSPVPSKVLELSEDDWKKTFAKKP